MLALKDNFYDRTRYEGRLEGILEGRLEGKLEGKLEGILEGILEGKLEGKLEGVEETRFKMVINMIRDNLSSETISNYAEMSIEEINKIREENSI